MSKLMGWCGHLAVYVALDDVLCCIFASFTCRIISAESPSQKGLPFYVYMVTEMEKKEVQSTGMCKHMVEI